MVAHNEVRYKYYIRENSTSIDKFNEMSDNATDCEKPPNIKSFPKTHRIADKLKKFNLYESLNLVLFVDGIFKYRFPVMC